MATARSLFPSRVKFVNDDGTLSPEGYRALSRTGIDLDTVMTAITVLNTLVGAAVGFSSDSGDGDTEFIPGPPGQQGPHGDLGAALGLLVDAEASVEFIPGPKGDQGAQGSAGATVGLLGNDEPSFEFIPGPQGQQGPQGVPGAAIGLMFEADAPTENIERPTNGGNPLTDNAAVTVPQGGTGRATSTTAYGLLAAGTTATGAHQTLAAGATTEILVGGGPAALPVWTTAQGSGAPVRATTPTLTTPIIASSTFASLPSAASSSGSYAFASDLGTNGTLVRSNGSRWLPVGGRVVLKVSAASGAIGNSETIVSQTQLPAGVMAAGDTISVTFSATKSGTTDSTTWTLRVGTAGTTGDTNLETANNVLMSAAQVNGNAQCEFIIVSATSTQRLGAQAGQSFYSAASANATQAAVAITNVSNSLYISLGILSSGATNTTALQMARIELVTG